MYLTRMLGRLCIAALCALVIVLLVARAYDHERVVYCTPVVQDGELYAEDCYTR